jgi:hypothetical protein
MGWSPFDGDLVNFVGDSPNRAANLRSGRSGPAQRLDQSDLALLHRELAGLLDNDAQPFRPRRRRGGLPKRHYSISDVYLIRSAFAVATVGCEQRFKKRRPMGNEFSGTTV